MTRTETILWLFDEMNCGAAVLGDSGAVLSLNKSAERMLAKHGYDGAGNGVSPALAAKALRGLFGRDFAGASIVATNGPRSSDLRPLIGYRMQLGAGSRRYARSVFVLVDLDETPRASIGALRHAFGLTKAEARLAARLARGESLQHIAIEQNVTIDTARAQLKAVLAKTHTHRQAELVALVNRLALVP